MSIYTARHADGKVCARATDTHDCPRSHDYARDAEPLDVWLRIPDDDNPGGEADAEANTYRDGDRYRVDWSLTAVGLVKSPPTFATYAAARAWLTGGGFEDFSS